MGKNERSSSKNREDEQKHPLIPEIVVPIAKLSVPSVIEMMTIYREIFGRGPHEREESYDAEYVISQLEQTGFGYPELRFGANIGNFFNVHSKFRARRRSLFRADDKADLTAYFYFDHNLDRTQPNELAHIELAEELKRRFAIETGNRLLELDIGVIPQEGEILL